jgi:hypothetical protein
VQSWTARRGNGAVQSAIAPTIAVGSDGVVWVAADGNLIRLDPKSSKVSSLPLPTPPTNPSVESVRPSGMKEVHSIRALAVDRSGHVAIALSGSRQVLVFDDATSQFARLELPTDMDAWSLGYFADGGLAIGTSDKSQQVAKVLVATPEGKIVQTISVPDATRLIPLPSGSTMLAGILGPTKVAKDGSVGKVTLPEGVVPNQTLGGLAPLPDGGLVVATIDSLVDVRPNGTTAGRYRFPVGPCPPYSHLVDDLERKLPTECPAVAAAIQPDARGSIWMVNLPVDPARGAHATLDVLAELK